MQPKTKSNPYKVKWNAARKCFLTIHCTKPKTSNVSSKWQRLIITSCLSHYWEKDQLMRTNFQLPESLSPQKTNLAANAEKTLILSMLYK